MHDLEILGKKKKFPTLEDAESSKVFVNFRLALFSLHRYSASATKFLLGYWFKESSVQTLFYTIAPTLLMNARCLIKALTSLKSFDGTWLFSAIRSPLEFTSIKLILAKAIAFLSKMGAIHKFSQVYLRYKQLHRRKYIMVRQERRVLLLGAPPVL